MTLALPNLLIAGVGKAGTTSLFRYLAQHPEICGSRPKEPGYFSPLRFSDTPTGSLPPVSRYASCVAHCDDQRYRLEGTPDYSYGGVPVIEAVREILGTPRILFILRDPVERFWSSFRYTRGRTQLPSGLEVGSYLTRCEQLRAEGCDTRREHRFYRALTVGCYDEYIPLWLGAFGASARVVFFEDMAADGAGVLRELCCWLGLDPAPVERFSLSSANATTGHRSALVQRMAYRIADRSGFGMERWPKLHGLVRRSYDAVNARPEQESLPADVRARLQQFYAPSAARLASDLATRGCTALPGWLPAASSGGST